MYTQQQGTCQGTCTATGQGAGRTCAGHMKIQANNNMISFHVMLYTPSCGEGRKVSDVVRHTPSYGEGSDVADVVTPLYVSACHTPLCEDVATLLHVGKEGKGAMW